MHGFSQSISNFIVGAIMVIFGLSIGLLIFTENNQQQSANSIVQSALVNASDDNAKVIDGTLAINTDKFEQNLQDSNLVKWRQVGRRNNSNAKMSFGVYYLDDNSKNANDFHQLEINPDKHTAIKTIKGVKVVVLRLIPINVDAALNKLNTADKNEDISFTDIQDTHKMLSKTDLQQMNKNDKIYLIQPTDVITYLVSGHGDLRKDDISNGLPKTKPDTNKRDLHKGNNLNHYDPAALVIK